MAFTQKDIELKDTHNVFLRTDVELLVLTRTESYTQTQITNEHMSFSARQDH